MAHTLSPSHINLGDGVEMRHFEAGEGDVLYEFVDENRGHIGRWFDWVDVATQGKIHERLRRDLGRQAQDEKLLYGLFEDARLIGRVSLSLDANEPAYVDYMLAKDRVGRGIAFRAVRTLLQIAILGLGVEQVYFYIDERNVRSAGFAAKLGAKRDRNSPRGERNFILRR